MVSAGTAPVCTEIPYTVPSSFISPSEVSQDLRDYFSRPRMIRTGTLPAARGAIVSDEVGVASLSTWYPNFLTRLAGVYAIRFSICFTVRVSTTPFNQGILCSSFQYASSIGNAYEYTRGTFSFSADQVPSVTINFEESNECTLKVPFLSTLEYLPLRGGFVNVLPYGTWTMNNLVNAPALPTTSNPTYKVYIHLEDLELIGVTSLVDNTATLNSGYGTKDNVRVVRRMAKGIAIADRELRKSKVISSTLGSVGKALSLVSKVPVIGSYMGTPSWLANTLAKTASAFGYAAPAMEEACQLKLDRQTLDPTHIDVPIASSKLSNFQSNKLEISEAMGASTEDQMSFAYVLSKPSQIYVGAVTTANISNTLVYGTKISPMSFWFRSTGNGNIPMPTSSTATTNCIYPSNIMNLCDHFRYWRGGLTFNIEFSKTQFHAGQLLVTFIPFAETGSANVINNIVRIPETSGGLTQPNQFSMLLDLRSGNSFDFHVPFIFDTPYASVNDSTGSLSMVVVNPLLATSTQVATSIDFIVRVSARDDFEFTVPVPPSFCVTNTNFGEAFLQSGYDTMDNSENYDGFGGDVIVEPSANIIGEKFNSLKQLAMIPTWFHALVPNITIAEFVIPHWTYTPSFTLATPMSTTASAPLATSHTAKIASMYSFSNGSTRFTVQPQGEPGPANIVAYYKSNPSNVGTASYSGFGNARSKRLFTNGGTIISSYKATTFDVPLYSRVQRLDHANFHGQTNIRNYAGVPIAGLVHQQFQCQSMPMISVRNTSGAARQFHFSYSAGEDATAVAFIGPSPVILFNSAATASPNASTLFVEG